MKKAVLATIIVSTLSATGIANAELLQSTISAGYARSHAKVDNASEDLNGFNIKYRYELNNDWGMVGSFVHTNYNKDAYGYVPDLQGKPQYTKLASGDLDYFSVTAGPSYRFNDYLSAYALVGLGYGKAHVWDGEFSASSDKTSAAYGAGFQINPMPNLVIDASYEYSKLGDVKVGTWMAGIGYRF